MWKDFAASKGVTKWSAPWPSASAAAKAKSFFLKVQMSLDDFNKLADSAGQRKEGDWSQHELFRQPGAQPALVEVKIGENVAHRTTNNDRATLVLLGDEKPKDRDPVRILISIPTRPPL